jgi:hypothetical protein
MPSTEEIEAKDATRMNISDKVMSGDTENQRVQTWPMPPEAPRTAIGMKLEG